jgi:hypothetical protein
MLWSTGCVLVGYDPTSQDADTPVIEAGSDAATAATADVDAQAEPEAATLDAEVELDARVDALSIDASDGMTDAEPQEIEDASFPCARDGGCACPPDGSVCAGDLWLSCNAQGAIALTTNCHDLSAGCNESICKDGVGCTTQPAADGSACDDGLFCTAIDQCAGGACTGAGTPCTDNVCLA